MRVSIDLTLRSIVALILLICQFLTTDGKCGFGSFAIGSHLIDKSLINLILAAKTRFVTCGSVLKLLNADYKTRLHSHDVKVSSDVNYGHVSANLNV